MELYQLRYFKEVAEHENISKASHKLHVAQPAITRSIHKLENELGVELFDRIGRRILLNENGRIFLRSVQGALDSIDSVDEPLQRYLRKKAHTLNFISLAPLGDAEDIVLDFLEQHPDIFIRFASSTTSYLETERPDMIFFPSFREHIEPNCLKLGEEHLVVAVSKNHPLAEQSSVKLKDLRDESFVLILPSKIREVIDGMFLEAGFNPYVKLEVQECRTIGTFVSRGIGISIAPSITWFSSDDFQKMTLLPIEDIRRKRSLYLKWSDTTRLSPAAKLFKNYLTKYYQELAIKRNKPHH